MPLVDLTPGVLDRAVVVGGSTLDLGGDGGSLLFVLGPLLLGAAFGWFARRPAFGGAVTAVGVIGFAITFWLATSDTVIQSGDDGTFDDLADALLTVVVFGSLLLAFGLLGLVGLGALGGSFLRALTADEPADRDPPQDEPPDPGSLSSGP